MADGMTAEVADGMAAAEKLYVLGHPVAHSKSPAMHNAAYRALGLPWSYELADCATEASAQAFLNARNWRACNVTMPWKPLALACATHASEAARLAQGANVLVNWAGHVHADNTDGKGCVTYLERCGVRFDGARVAVCGTGPTSFAIAHACAAAGAVLVCLLGRDEARASGAVAGYLERCGRSLEDAISGGARSAEPKDLRSSETLFEAHAYDEAGLAAIAESSVIVDATPLGMKPGDPAPFDVSALRAGQTVFDVVYGHGETALIAAARAAGCAAYDGAGMLVAQAVETVLDISRITGYFEIPAHLDLFAIMAEAAGFDYLA